MASAASFDTAMALSRRVGASSSSSTLDLLLPPFSGTKIKSGLLA
eukprot:gene31097-6224_t